METTIKQRVKEYCKHAGIPILEFEKRNGMSNGYVNGISKGIGEPFLKTISLNFPDLNMEWLMTGNGEMVKEAKETGNEVTELCGQMKIAPLVPVDIIRKPNVRVWDFVRRHRELYDRTPDQMMPDFDLMYTMRGNALSPVIERGDTIYLQWQELSTDSIINGHVYWIDTKRNGILIKKVYVEDEKLLCYALMGKQPVKTFSVDDLFDIFSIVAITKTSIPNLDMMRDRENLLGEVISQNGTLVNEISAHRKLLERLIDRDK